MKHRPRREWDNQTASQPEPNARLAFAFRNRFFNHFALCWARGAGAGVSPDHREPRSGRYEVCERGLSTRFSNHHQEFIRRQPRGSFGINAPDCKQVLPTTSRLRLLGWPTTLRLLTNLICNRPLSSSDSSTKTLFCVRRVEALRPQPLRSATAAPAFCDRRPFLCRRSTFLCRRANFFCRRSTHVARPQHLPFRSSRHIDPPNLPPILRQSAVHRLAIRCPSSRTSDCRVRSY